MSNRTADERVADPELWFKVQKIAYPNRYPSVFGPFPRAECSPKIKQASWLYHELLNDNELRIKVRL